MLSTPAILTTEQDAAIVSTLQATDWDFTDSSTESNVHNIHPFPAKFIPEIPRKILALTPVQANTAVLDPFAGSGTTLLEAQRSGHDFAGVDLNPIAVLISRVKTSGVEPGSLEAARMVTNERIGAPLVHWRASCVESVRLLV